MAHEAQHTISIHHKSIRVASFLEEYAAGTRRRVDLHGSGLEILGVREDGIETSMLSPRSRSSG